jgi:serine/threonine protein kinase
MSRMWCPSNQCGEIDEQFYVDMRLIEGTDLRAMLTRHGPLSPARTVAIVRQIAAALPSAPSPTNVPPLRIADRYVAGRKHR